MVSSVMADYNNFQRLGFAHNAGVGRRFEEIARRFFWEHEALDLLPALPVNLGVSERKKFHRFDLGSTAPATIVECKSHTWTQGGKMPSAKMTVWNEAMYYFHLAPSHFRKIMFLLKHDRAGSSLATYYLKPHGHLVPDDVEFWEYEEGNTGNRRR